MQPNTTERGIQAHWWGESNTASLPRLCAALTGLLGFAVLCGWALDVPLLKSVLPGAVEMKANAAVGLILSAAALFILSNRQSSWQRVGQTLALAVGALGVTTCGQYLFAWDLGIDELLFRDTGTAYNLIRGRMSPYTATAFAAIGFALFVLPQSAGRLHVRIAAAGVATIGALSCVGYLWNASELVTDRLLPPVAIHTGVALLLLGAGTLLSCRAPETRPAGALKELTRVEAKILGAFFGALLLLFVGGGYTYRASVEYAHAMDNIARSQQVRAESSRLYATITDAGIAQRNYLISGATEERETFVRQSAAASTQEKLIEQLVANDAEQMQNLVALRGLLATRDKMLGRTIDVFDQEGFAAARASLMSGRESALMQGIRLLFERIDAGEASELESAQAQAVHVRRLTLVSLILTLAMASGVFLLLFYGIRREMLARRTAESYDATYRRVLLLFATSASREHSLRGMLQMLAGDHAYVGCAFDALDQSGGLVTREAKYGSMTAAPAECRLGDGCVGQAAATNRTVEVASATSDSSRDRTTPSVETVWVLSTPVAYRGQRFGLLTIVARKSFSSRARAFIEQIAAQLGVALDSAQQYNDACVLADQLRVGSEHIEQKNIQLEQASRMKSEFLATMSHELRTPLNAIIGFADVLRDGLLGELTPAQREHVGDILDSGEHLLGLINDILDLSKVEAGRMELDLEPLQLRPLLQNALSMVKEKALAQGLRLTLEVDEDMPVLSADARKLKQILYNLLANAVKFTGEGGAVTLKASRCPAPEGERLVLSVSDTGLGIATEDQARLFQPFVQVDSSIARNYGGTGLGLVMVKRLAELHGGEVALASEPGKGSTFTVVLPYRSPAPIEEKSQPVSARTQLDREKPASAIAAPDVPLVAESGKRVLVVDDDEMSVEIISAFLDGAGFIAIRASHGHDALEKARRLQPDLVVLDLMMPEVSGFEVVEAMKADAATRAIPIIALTSKVFTSEDAQALNNRVDGVLHKDDFDNTVFIAEVQRALAEASRTQSARPAVRINDRVDAAHQV